MTSQPHLSTSKQIRIIEAVSYMIGTLSKLHEQGIDTVDFPDELIALRANLHDTYAMLARSLPEQGKTFLSRSGLKIQITGPEQASKLEKKLFELGFAYLIGGNLVQSPTANENVIGMRVNKRGHLSLFFRDEDEAYFSADLSRLVSGEAVMKAKRYDEI